MSVWTVDSDETLKLRVSQGAPYSVIGGEIGCSRNAVAGRVHRLGLKSLNPVSLPGLPSKAKAAAKTFIKNREITIMPKRKEEPPELEADPIKEEAYVEGTGVALLDIEPGQCRWPLNAPPRGSQYFFCGEPNAGGGWAYCLCHLRRSMPEDAFRRLRIAA